jgi:hypothetical protein
VGRGHRQRLARDRAVLRRPRRLLRERALLEDLRSAAVEQVLRDVLIRLHDRDRRALAPVDHEGADVEPGLQPVGLLAPGGVRGRVVGAVGGVDAEGAGVLGDRLGAGRGIALLGRLLDLLRPVGDAVARVLARGGAHVPGGVDLCRAGRDLGLGGARAERGETEYRQQAELACERPCHFVSLPWGSRVSP